MKAFCPSDHLAKQIGAGDASIDTNLVYSAKVLTRADDKNRTGSMTSKWNQQFFVDHIFFSRSIDGSKAPRGNRPLTVRFVKPGLKFSPRDRVHYVAFQPE
jgi:hypothetical protein